MIDQTDTVNDPSIPGLDTIWRNTDSIPFTTIENNINANKNKSANTDEHTNLISNETNVVKQSISVGGNRFKPGPSSLKQKKKVHMKTRTIKIRLNSSIKNLEETSNSFEMANLAKVKQRRTKVTNNLNYISVKEATKSGVRFSNDFSNILLLKCLSFAPYTNYYNNDNKKSSHYHSCCSQLL